MKYACAYNCFGKNPNKSHAENRNRLILLCKVKEICLQNWFKDMKQKSLMAFFFLMGEAE